MSGVIIEVEKSRTEFDFVSQLKLQAPLEDVNEAPELLWFSNNELIRIRSQSSLDAFFHRCQVTLLANAGYNLKSYIV
ncbi:MAG: hypothetical protein R3C11_23345 [Planctomycetaceae bacterium]